MRGTFPAVAQVSTLNDPAEARRRWHSQPETYTIRIDSRLGNAQTHSHMTASPLSHRAKGAMPTAPPVQG